MIFILKNKTLLQNSIKEQLFDLDYIKVFVLIIAYFKLCDVPTNILDICIDGQLEDDDYKEIYTFLADKWEGKAKNEIDDIIYQIENGEDI